MGAGAGWALAGLAGFAGLTACSASGPAPVAYENRVFYNYGFGGGAAGDTSGFEKPYAPLDFAEKKPNPEYVGVAVLGEHVRISRPKNWVIRAADNRVGGRFIEYVSPSQYVFAVYERADPPDDLWRDIVGRYEEDAKAAGAELVGARVPFATWNAQGRAFVVRRSVPAAKQPFISTSREILLRSQARVILVQIVHQGDTLAPVSDELHRVLQTLQVY